MSSISEMDEAAWQFTRQGLHDELISVAFSAAGGVGMAASKDNDQFGEAETIRRREATLKRMLSTPHRPQTPIGKKKKILSKRKPKDAAPRGD